MKKMKMSVSLSSVFRNAQLIKFTCIQTGTVNFINAKSVKFTEKSQ